MTMNVSPNKNTLFQSVMCVNCETKLSKENNCYFIWFIDTVIWLNHHDVKHHVQRDMTKRMLALGKKGPNTCLSPF